MPSSFFSAPRQTLDPALFVGEKMRPEVRDSILVMLYGHLQGRYANCDSWSRAYLAGSAISHQWSMRESGAGDLDVLVGIEYVGFRKANPTYKGLTDAEISAHLTDDFRDHLRLEDWIDPNGGGKWDVTFFVNKGSFDIKAINPYAAYLLNTDEWIVRPPKEPPIVPEAWESRAESLHELAMTSVERYAEALHTYQNSPNPAGRASAKRYLHDALDHVSGVYESVHDGRKQAFAHYGGGYDDMNNFLWQAGKRDGWLDAVREMYEYREQLKKRSDVSAYGTELPDHNTLLRRAMTAYSSSTNTM